MRILIIFSIALLFGSCTKDEPIPEPEIYNGFGSAEINGEVREFRPSMKFHESKDSYGIVLDYYFQEVMKAQIHFRLFSNGEDLQILFQENENNQFPQAIYSTRIGDGDVAGNYYFLNEGDEIEDYLQLISFDESTGKVVGEFQASFVVDTAQIFDPNSPDTIVITNGYFETTIIK